MWAHQTFLFQQHGIRRYSTLSKVLLIWGKSPLWQKSPVSLCGLAWRRTLLTGASYAWIVIRAKLAKNSQSSEKPWGARLLFRPSQCVHCRPHPTLSVLCLYLLSCWQIHLDWAISTTDSIASTCARVLFRESPDSAYREKWIQTTTPNSLQISGTSYNIS